MSIFFCILAILSAVFFSLAVIDYYKNLAGFTDKKGAQTKFGILCTKIFAPKPKTDNWVNLKNKLTILNNEMTIDGFCLTKGISMLLGFLIALSVSGTIIFDNYNSVFVTDVTIPIQFDQKSYNTLITNLAFDNSSSDLKILENNVGMLQNESFKTSCEKVTTSSLYDYVLRVRSRLHHIFGFSSVLSFLAILLLAFFIPKMTLDYVYQLLVSKALIEYDSLETDISINAEMAIPDILNILIVNAMYFRNMLLGFRDLYAVSPKRAYHTILTRQEFPRKFKDLIRYLEMLEIQGPAYVQDTIDFSKTQSQDEIISHYRRAAYKRIQRPKRLCILCFLIAIARIFLTLFYMMLENMGGGSF